MKKSDQLLRFQLHRFGYGLLRVSVLAFCRLQVHSDTIGDEVSNLQQFDILVRRSLATCSLDLFPVAGFEKARLS